MKKGLMADNHSCVCHGALIFILDRDDVLLNLIKGVTYVWKSAFAVSSVRRTGSEYERVAQNIITLKENGIKFSLNYVLLRNINNSPAQIEAIVDYAKQSGAYALKFLELLVWLTSSIFMITIVTFATLKKSCKTELPLNEK